MSNLERLWDWMSHRGEHKGMAARSVLVIGLGRFGSALATTLMDMNAQLVNDWSDKLTQVRMADGTSAKALTQLGATTFDAAVVAIGTDIESSILATAALSDLGVDNIWAKAITSEHGRILERVGAHHVVYPERQMGERVARVVTGQVLDYFVLDEGFVLAEVFCPPALVGKTLATAGIRDSFGVTVVCVKPPDGSFTYATPDTALVLGELLLVAGPTSDVERFARFAVRT